MAKAKVRPVTTGFGKKKADSIAKTTKKVIKKLADKRRVPVKAPEKPQFDADALIFETALADIEKGLELLSERFEGAWDGQTEPWDDDADYILAWWHLNLPEAKRRGVKTIMASARERAILGVYRRE